MLFVYLLLVSACDLFWSIEVNIVALEWLFRWNYFPLHGSLDEKILSLILFSNPMLSYIFFNILTDAGCVLLEEKKFIMP